MRRLAFLSLTLLLGIAVSVGYPSPAGSAQQKKKNTTKQETDRSEYYKRWLNEDVIYIVSSEEKSVFKELKTDEEREKFIEQFWARRNADPRSGDNAFKEEHYRRVAYANERFASGIPGWKTDRGRVYIMYGKPDEIDSHPSGGSYQREIYEGGGQTSTYPFERWRYRHIDGIGDDIEIEFVDKSMSGEYRIAMDPDEKDALLMVPNAGLTLAEEMGLSDKSKRPYFNPGAGNDPSTTGFMRAKDMPFARMEQYFALQRPPQIKFEDLKTAVTTRVTYNQLPYAMRIDFIRLASDKVLVPVTVEMTNKDLEFKKDSDLNRAGVNVYGVVTSLTGRIMAEFEDVISTEYSDSEFQAGKQARSEYQKVIALPPGQRYKLDLVLKDINSGNMGIISRGINVPKYDSEDALQASSVILANSILPAPETSNQLGQFVIGDLKVQPNVKAEYVPGQYLIPYLQVYNATIDQTSQKPSVEVSYAIKNAEGKLIQQLQDLAGNSVEFFSGVRLVVVNKIQLKDFGPGKYTLEIKVTDLISNKSVSSQTDFKVNEPVKAASTAKPQ
jgi:GWxTD domain-containing protein